MSIQDTRGTAFEGKDATSVRATHQTAPTLFIDAGDVRFAYRRLGAPSGVPLLFLQHFRGNMDNWDPAVVDGLAAARPVLLLDNRGVSRSSGTTPDTVAAMGRDVLAFVDALGETHIDLLGFSLGGMVAQQVLLDRPKLVRRAILAGTGAPGAVDMFNAEVTAAATKYPSDAGSLLFLFFEQTPTSQDAGRRFLRRMSARTDREPPTSEQVMRSHLAAIRAWGTMDGAASARLRSVEQPILVVNGSHDIMIPTVNAFTLSQTLPNAELILYPNSGHGSLFQYPEWFVDDASRFLDRGS
jgi:pimeloyl-ACP methyl ester carboxylesterase